MNLKFELQGTEKVFEYPHQCSSTPIVSSSVEIVKTPFLSKINSNEPFVPIAPSHLLKQERTSATVRLLLLLAQWTTESQLHQILHLI